MPTRARAHARLSFAVVLSTVFVAFASRARADDVAKGSEESATATKGSTDVTSEGFDAAAKHDDADSKDATELSVSAGGLSAAGNSKLLAITASEKFRIRRGMNQLSILSAFNYGRSGLNGGEPQTTVDNDQGKLRYDRFLAPHLSAFLGVQGRRDRFAGLDLRLQIDPGLAYYVIDEAKSQLWFEGGYDYLHDIRRDDALVDPKTGAPILDANGAPLDKTKTVHSGRAFVGYDHNVSEGVSLVFGLEYLAALTDTTFWKLNGDAMVTSKLGKAFALATAFSFRYDHAPLPGKEKLDELTSVSLVWTMQ
jgi:putative salt-induced outer membrane protein